MNKAFFPLIAATLLMSGCGGIVGGTTGALACSNLGKGNGKVAITAACGVFGALAGMAVQDGMSNNQPPAYNQAPANHATYRAMQTRVGTPVPWYDRDTGYEGEVIPRREYRSRESGMVCREYQQKAIIAGRPQETFGTACQQSDGSWKKVS